MHECDVGKSRYDREHCDPAIDDGDVGRLSSVRRGGTDQIDRAPSGLRKRGSHIRMPRMRVTSHLHRGAQLTRRGHGSPQGRTTSTGNRSAPRRLSQTPRPPAPCPGSSTPGPGELLPALQRPVDEILTGSGTFPDRGRSGLDTLGTARAGSARRQPGLLIERTRSSSQPSKFLGVFLGVLRCGELLRTQRSSEGRHARRNRGYEDEPSRRTG
jgi:hypothetical protein